MARSTIMAAEAADQQNQENERKRVAREEEEILYRDANGQPFSIFKAMHQLVLNTLVPYRERALLAEGRLEKAREGTKLAINAVNEDHEQKFEEKYGKPNNRGGRNGFVISPINIKDVEVVWDNEAAIIRFGDRRIAPRIKEWLDWHRNVLPAETDENVDVPSACQDFYLRKRLSNGMVVGRGDKIVIRVSDERREVIMRVDRLKKREGEVWVQGSVPKSNLPRFSKTAIVSERRVLRYADPD